MDRFTGRGRIAAVAALADPTALGELTFPGRISERAPVLRRVDEWGRA